MSLRHRYPLGTRPLAVGRPEMPAAYLAAAAYLVSEDQPGTSYRCPFPLSVAVTVNVASSFTVADVPSAFVMCAS
jgi:hypothetical protein